MNVEIKCAVCGSTKTHPEYRVKQGYGKFCSRKCSSIAKKGRSFPHSKAHEEKRLKAVREAAKNRVYPRGYTRPRNHVQPMLEGYKRYRDNNPEAARSTSIRNLSKSHSLDLSGENSPAWKGGKTKGFQIWKSKHSSQLEVFRKAVLKRDGGTCKECGSTTKVQAHHVVGIAENPAYAFLRMNGVSLCQVCHKKTPNFGGKALRFKVSLGNTIATIRTVPNHFQDYLTPGNWAFGTDGSILIFVSAMGDWRYELLVALHELIEVGLCKHRGISQESVDAFDIRYESERARGLHTLEDEPGDDPAAPYKKEHFFATSLERLMATELGVDWDQYGRKVVEL